MSAKIIMQDIWQLNLDWDEPVDEKMRKRWIDIANDIKDSINITIPRSYFDNPTLSEEDIQLHVFMSSVETLQEFVKSKVPTAKKIVKLFKVEPSNEAETKPRPLETLCQVLGRKGVIK